MAQKVQVILVDDVDGGEATETVSFALDGVSYEIDVSEKNAAKPCVTRSPRGWGTPAGSAAVPAVAVVAPGPGPAAAAEAPRRSRGNSKHDLSDVRSWARENGFQVSDRGRVSSEVITAYEKAH